VEIHPVVPDGRHSMNQQTSVELVLDCAEPRSLADFWREALDYRDYFLGANLAVLVPKTGIAPHFSFRECPNPKRAKIACIWTSSSRI
jgi:hypothetical protein